MMAKTPGSETPAGRTSQSALSRKLLIRPGMRVAIVGAPGGFDRLFRPLPDDVSVLRELEPELPFLLLFVRSREDLETSGPEAVQSLTRDAVFWIAYPKKSGKLKTDINRDVGWEVIDKAGFEGVAQVAIDADWSASRFRPKELVGKSRRT